MKPLYTLLAVIAALALASLACGVNITLPDDAIEIIDIQTETLQIPVPEPGSTTDVLIEFGAGELTIEPGAVDVLMTGTATYNVENLKPDFSTSGSSFTLRQESYDFKLGGLPNVNEIENTWELYFSDAPIDLEIRTGAVQGDFEFGGMAIEDLKVVSGASSIDLAFSTPNLTLMGQFRYTTGASSSTISGLGNANFSLMNFQGGAGSYTLDFSGSLQRDATVQIDAALGTVRIVVPENVPATVQVESTLTTISTGGAWAGSGSNFSQAGQGSSLTIIVKIGAGTLELGN